MGTPTRQRDGSYYVYDGTERQSMGLCAALLLPVVTASKLLPHASVGLGETSVRRPKAKIVISFRAGWD